MSDIEIQANEILKERDRLNQILSFHTGQSIEFIAKATDRDKYYSAAEAKEFGIVDDVFIKSVPGLEAHTPPKLLPVPDAMPVNVPATR